MPDKITLKYLAEETGGDVFTNLDRKHIGPSFPTISETISNMYSVTFEPAEG